MLLYFRHLSGTLDRQSSAYIIPLVGSLPYLAFHGLQLRYHPYLAVYCEHILILIYVYALRDSVKS